jgi:hypothetical protein
MRDYIKNDYLYKHIDNDPIILNMLSNELFYYLLGELKRNFKEIINSNFTSEKQKIECIKSSRKSYNDLKIHWKKSENFVSFYKNTTSGNYIILIIFKDKYSKFISLPDEILINSVKKISRLKKVKEIKNVKRNTEEIGN